MRPYLHKRVENQERCLPQLAFPKSGKQRRPPADLLRFFVKIVRSAWLGNPQKVQFPEFPRIKPCASETVLSGILPTGRAVPQPVSVFHFKGGISLLNPSSCEEVYRIHLPYPLCFLFCRCRKGLVRVSSYGEADRTGQARRCWCGHFHVRSFNSAPIEPSISFMGFLLFCIYCTLPHLLISHFKSTGTALVLMIGFRTGIVDRWAVFHIHYERV
ncbi:unnamed protein product [Tuber aestivum]|uniref:Uncharacterized protein n=1 Tax=Tuber aestivum TaxID=59557 RepID=A0A292PU16_9PEZI|nr:unnamed protein product [Tuber aestivum]